MTSRSERSIQRSAEEQGIKGPTPSGEYHIQCPFCITVVGKEDVKWKLAVNAGKKVFHCHRCNTSGRGDFKWLESTPQSRDIEAKQAPPEPLRLPEFIPLLGYPGEEGRGRVPLSLVPYTNYLRSRNITGEAIAQANLGACLSGRYAGRVIVPHPTNNYPIGSDWAGFAARAIHDVMSPRYLYPKGMKKADLIWGTWITRRTVNLNRVYVVEGVFDALRLFPCAVATYGKNISETQLELLAGLSVLCDELVIAFDGDAWQEGMLAAMRIQMRGDDRIQRKVLYTRLPPKTDPGSLGLREVEKYIQRP